MTDSPKTSTPLWLLLARVSKHEATSVTTSALQGWRISRTKNEAIGSFTQVVLTEKPGFGIDEILCFELPPEAMRSALGLSAPRTDAD